MTVIIYGTTCLLFIINNTITTVLRHRWAGVGITVKNSKIVRGKWLNMTHEYGK